ncbi:MAG: arsenic resistance protein [Rhodospirillales bacterium]|nr:arsenic resistance protein [Rhodospirillales bacterium]
MWFDRWHEFLKTRLVWNVATAIGVGLVLGRILEPHRHGYGALLETGMMASVFLMIYPMMVTIRLEAFRDAVRNVRGILLSLVFNFVWAPLFGFVLAAAFLDQPEVAFGFLLVMTVPCSAMTVGYAGLTKGNVELATIIVAISFLLALAAVPLWLALLGGAFDIPIPYASLGQAIVTMLVLPMILGYLSRRGLVARLGKEGFQRIMPFFPAVTMTAMLVTIFLIFFLKATILLDQWPLMLWLMVPNALFMAGTFLVVTIVDRAFGLSYGDHMAIAFASTGKNNATAIAIATAAFSPMVAVPAATLPIFQIVFMIVYLRLAPWLRSLFDPPPTGSAIPIPVVHLQNVGRNKP